MRAINDLGEIHIPQITMATRISSQDAHDVSKGPLSPYTVFGTFYHLFVNDMLRRRF